MGLLAVVACTPPAAVDAAAEMGEIRAVEAAHTASIAAGDLSNMAAWYAPEASLFVHDMAPVNTREAIDALFEGAVARGAVAHSNFSVTPGTGFVASSGDLAYTTSTYVFTNTDPETQQPTSTTGTALLVWRKQPDGQWRVVADASVAH